MQINYHKIEVFIEKNSIVHLRYYESVSFFFQKIKTSVVTKIRNRKHKIRKRKPKFFVSIRHTWGKGIDQPNYRKPAVTSLCKLRVFPLGTLRAGLRY